MRKDGIFIAVEIGDEAARDSQLAHALAEACPVDIFAEDSEGHVEIVQENLDECVLCRLCLDATPQGAVRVLKLYDNERVLA